MACDISQIQPSLDPSCVFTNDGNVSNFTFLDSKSLDWAGQCKAIVSLD